MMNKNRAAKIYSISYTKKFSLYSQTKLFKTEVFLCLGSYFRTPMVPGKSKQRQKSGVGLKQSVNEKIILFFCFCDGFADEPAPDIIE
jgi:hypothetical protein